MDQDDGARQAYAVGISVYTANGTGTLRLALDDLELDMRSTITWRHWSFFTFIDLPSARVRSLSLTDLEYAAIGKAVLARLMALQSLSAAE